jgi:hypothetical protein
MARLVADRRVREGTKAAAGARRIAEIKSFMFPGK